MNRTKIEWTDYSWNPIKGLCPTGCWYCYARRMYQRFKWNPELRWDFNPFISHGIPKGSKIFICSTIELFHPSIKEDWRNWIFMGIENNPEFTFQILTKFPQNIDRPMPDNVWLGITITNKEEYEYMISHFARSEASIKFFSLEPLFEDIAKLGQRDYEYYFAHYANWIIVGRLTGHGKKYDPKREWIERIVKICKMYFIPIFLKNNLKEIWGKPLIQEFPKEGK